MTLHKDVLETVISSQVNRILSGEKVSAEEIIELLLLSREDNYRNYLEMAEQALEYGKLVIERQDNIKIYDLFLRNHGLEEEFDKFHTRIIRKKYSLKEPKP